MDTPNKLTLLRIALIFVFMFFLFIRHPFGRYGALLVFLVAAMTDYLDGKIARQTKKITKFGTLVDPLADKMLISAAFISFVEMQIIPAWMVVIVIGREFAIMGLRTLAAFGGKILVAERLGKQKTVSQFSIIVAILILMAFEDILSALFLDMAPRLELWLEKGIFYFMFGVVVITVVSGLSYLGRNRKLLEI